MSTLPIEVALHKPPPLVRSTEAEMLEALFQRYASKASQGTSIRYACASHVRSHAGFDARRVCDFMAQDLWVAQGLHLHGHEVKVSRSDWLREMADWTKSDEFMRYCHRWWLVVPDARIVKGDELPDNWGLMALRDGRLRVVRPGPRLDAQPVPPTFRASLMRAVAQTYAVRGFGDLR